MYRDLGASITPIGNPASPYATLHCPSLRVQAATKVSYHTTFSKIQELSTRTSSRSDTSSWNWGYINLCTPLMTIFLTGYVENDNSGRHIPIFPLPLKPRRRHRGSVVAFPLILLWDLIGSDQWNSLKESSA